MINDINIFMTRIYGLILDIFCSVLCFILQLLKQGLTTKKKKGCNSKSKFISVAGKVRALAREGLTF